MLFSARATRWARQVVSGKIPSNRRVVAAARRHLADLRKVRPAGWEFCFDVAAAERACAFIERCVYTKGDRAVVVNGVRPTIKLEDVQCFIVCSLFGWMRRSTGKRRFRKAFIFLCRKNAKSELVAAICVYMLVADGEMGAEVFTGATSKDQAFTIFRPMREMVVWSEGLRDFYGVSVGVENLAVPRTSSFAKPIIGKPGDGASPHCAAIDEYHEHATSASFDAMNTGMGSRSQALLIVPTTAGDNLAGPCKEYYDHCCKVVDGLLEEETLFALIYELDSGDDWTSWENWRKVNPMLGVSLHEDFLRDQYRTALTDVRQQNVLRTRHLNQWVSTRSPWFNVLEWAACARHELSMDSFKGRPAWLGVDLASKKDLAEVCVLFRTMPAPSSSPDEPRGKIRYHMFWRHYLPEAAVLRPENEKYRTWRAMGRIIVTEGSVIDFAVIIRDILALARLIEIQKVGFDPFQGTMFSTEMMAAGMPMVEYGAQVKLFSDPLKEFDAIVSDHRLEHDGDPVAAWAASNVVAHRDAKDNVYPRKVRDSDKIDPIVAGCIALGLCMRDEDTRSVYEERDLVTLG